LPDAQQVERRTEFDGVEYLVDDSYLAASSLKVYRGE
jgi:hypothetical protein